MQEPHHKRVERLLPGLEAAVIVVHAGDEPAPFITGTPVGHQRGGAVFSGPVVMGDYVAQGNSVPLHEQGGQLGRLVVDDGGVMGGAFAHFNGYGVFVSRTGMVRVMACFRRGNVLVGSELVDREVPVQTAGFAAVQIAGMGVGVPLGVGRAVDGDEAGGHGGSPLPGISAFGHVRYADTYFPAHLVHGARHDRGVLRFEGDGRRPHFVVLGTAGECQGRKHGKKARPKRSVFHVPVLETGRSDCKQNLELVYSN